MELVATKKGSILVFSLVILALILMSALGIAATTLSQQRSTFASGASTVAFQNADKGVEIFLQKVYHESDPQETLEDLVSGGRLDSFKCDKTLRPGHLVLNDGTVGDFEIVGYKKPAPGQSGALVEVVDCTTELADIAQFRIVGEHAQAARALYVSISESITRGLLANWDFEDNAVALNHYGPGFGGSPIARDISFRNNHALTLCPLDDSPHGASIPFDGCPQIIDGSEALDETGTAISTDDIEDYYLDHDGNAWGSGAANQKSGTEGSESMVFNGETHYLAINTDVKVVPDDRVGSDDYYVDQGGGIAGADPASNYVDDSDYHLKPEDGLSIALWVKRDGSGPGVLVRNGDLEDGGTERGYSLLFEEDSKLHFRVQGGSSVGDVSVSLPAAEQWNHVVATWSKDHQRKPRIYINGTNKGSGNSFNSNIEYDSDIPFTVGGMYTDGDSEVLFDKRKYGNADGSKPIESGFDGEIDDLRIYDRALTENETKELCHKAIDSLKSKCS